MKSRIDVYRMEGDRKWLERGSLVPGISFRPEWKVAVIPPFGHADARFVVTCQSARVSVYLDFDSALGCMDEPYWEIYPMDGDCARFLLSEAKELEDGIAESIRQQLDPSTLTVGDRRERMWIHTRGRVKMWLSYWLGDFELFRRWHGGTWAFVYIDFPVASSMWLPVPDGATAEYREPLWRGKPEFRTYTR